jgi:Cu/Ag efflux pump CusA
MKLASLDLSFADVARALEANNANQGARYLEGPSRSADPARSGPELCP